MPQLEAGGEATNETVVAAEPTLEDRFAAHFGEEPDEQPQGEAPEGDAQAEPEEVELEEADFPAIEPPVSFTAEEKEAFKSWPREAQEAVTRRVGDLEKGLHAKAQEAKAEKQKAEQEAAERIAQAQTVHVETLKALLPEIPPMPDPRLQPRDPAGYADQLAQYQYAVAQHQQVKHFMQQVEAQQEAAERAENQRKAAQNEAILRDKLPEYFTDKGPELERSLRSTAIALGYSEDQLTNVDAIDVLAMKQASEWKAKADRYDTLMAKQMAKVREGKVLPKVSRPGVPVGKGVISGERLAADREAMRKGDADAAARVFGRHFA